jgi:hypothetical protein
LISESAQLAHVGALLRRFGFEVHELCGIPTPVQMTHRERCEVHLVIVDETLCTDTAVDSVARLGGVLSLSSILIVPRVAAPRPARRAPVSQRCFYLAPSFSPIDLTLAIIESIRQRKSLAN